MRRREEESRGSDELVQMPESLHVLTEANAVMRMSRIAQL